MSSAKFLKRFFVLCAFGMVWGCLLNVEINASPVYGTSAGTIITAVSSNLLIEYQDTNNNPQPTVTGDITVSDTVSAVYGLGLSVLSSSQTVPAASAATFTFTATNKSNTGTTLNFAYNDYYSLPVISYSNDSLKGDNDWIVTTLNGSTAYYVFEDAVAIVTINVTVNAAARNGVTGYVTMNVFLDSGATPNGSYVGLNGTNYGGVSKDATVISVTAASPELVIITKNISSLLAPTGINGYTGGASDLVPGSQLTYKIVIRNIGNATANATQIIQQVPAYTDYLRSNDGAGVDINGDGTAVVLSRELNISGSYVIDDESMTTIDPSVTHVRWTIQNIGAGESVTLDQFTVVVE